MRMLMYTQRLLLCGPLRCPSGSAVTSVLPTVHFYSVSQLEVLEMGPMALLECERALIL